MDELPGRCFYCWIRLPLLFLLLLLQNQVGLISNAASFNSVMVYMRGVSGKLSLSCWAGWKMSTDWRAVAVCAKLTVGLALHRPFIHLRVLYAPTGSTERVEHPAYTHTQPFYGYLSGSTGVGRYQKRHSLTHTWHILRESDHSGFYEAWGR